MLDSQELDFYNPKILDHRINFLDLGTNFLNLVWREIVENNHELKNNSHFKKYLL